MGEFNRRFELSNFLKKKRESLSPGDFGIKISSRRRTKGLIREEVAMISGLGVTWYTWLEQGREIQVSSSFLTLLCNGLRLNSVERSYVFNLAQLRAPALAPKSEEDTIGPLQDILDAISVPAYARTSYFDVIAWNKANTLFFGDFNLVPREDRNVILLMFTRAQYRLNMPDWENDARALVATLRLSLAESRDASSGYSLVENLGNRSPDFKRIWDQHDVSFAGEGVSKIMSRARAAISFRSHTLTTERSAGTRLVLFDPVTSKL